MKQAGETYQPSDMEEYMCPRQLAYFENKLHQLKLEVMSITKVMRQELQECRLGSPDLFDLASAYRGITHGVSDIQRLSGKLSMIDQALIRIKNGDYGYCQMTGEEIGLKRLQAQPVAIFCVEAQEDLERMTRSISGRQVPSFIPEVCN